MKETLNLFNYFKLVNELYLIKALVLLFSTIHEKYPTGLSQWQSPHLVAVGLPLLGRGRFLLLLRCRRAERRAEASGSVRLPRVPRMTHHKALPPPSIIRAGSGRSDRSAGGSARLVSPRNDGAITDDR